MIGIISDIHGNHVALTAVLNRLDELGVSEIICLGDISGYYCQINECCETLRARNIFSLMGNHDLYLTKSQCCPRSNSANVCLEYQKNVITPENMAWLSSLNYAAEIDGLRVVHGGWNDAIDEYIKPSDAYFHRLEGRYFASGHTHVPCIWHGVDKTYCNPGSVGQPRDGDPRASFATLNEGNFELHRIEYDIVSVQRAMSNAGFSSYFFENLSNGTQIGGKISSYG